MVKRYKTIVHEKEALLFTGENWNDCFDFVGRGDDVSRNFRDQEFRIHTLEGTVVASAGDYIIKGLRGEFYPCKPDIFEKSYELIEEAK